MLRFILSFSALSLILGHVVETTRSFGLYELQSTHTTHNVRPVSEFNRRALKIANGRSIPADVGQRFPYSVLLVFREDFSEISEPRICAGVLIQPQWVLTAGSCVQRARNVNEIFVGFGDDSPKPEDLLDHDDARLVLGHVIFPGFTGNPRDGADLALLYMRHPINSTSPRLPDDEPQLGEGQRLVGLGWGVTEVNSNYADRLQVADRFSFMEHRLCEDVWHEVNNVSAAIDERVICVWHRDVAINEASMSICDGDEGGPLLFLDTASFDFESRFTFGGNPAVDVVYGIASFGPRECGDEEFSVFTNIVEYMDWINSTITTFSPPNPNILEQTTPMEEEDDESDFIFIIAGAVGGFVAVAVLLACVVWYRASTRSPALSTGETSTTSLRKAEEAERRQQRIDLISLSPFLSAPEPEASQSGASVIASASQQGAGLPTDVHVTLIGNKLGSGAFGRVEQGVFVDESGVKHKVAVKFNFGEEESKDTLLNEIRIFERVGHHPNVVRCFGGRLDDSVEDEHGYFIIEELMASDLGKFYKDPKQRRKLTFGKFLEIFSGIAEGLEHLHKCEVIHFDLKPSNILLDEKLLPKLADFGCSRQRAHSYITAGARGTVAYMAPELWLLGMFVRRAQVRAEKVDIFSFGVVMWETFTNKSPKDPLSMKELLLGENEPVSDERGEANTNEDFKNDRFPFESARCPDPLKALIWDCVSYYNNLRPSIQEVKQRISELAQMEWVQQNIDNYKQ